MTDETSDANAAWRRYWNTVAGPRWAAAGAAQPGKHLPVAGALAHWRRREGSRNRLRHRRADAAACLSAWRSRSRRRGRHFRTHAPRCAAAGRRARTTECHIELVRAWLKEKRAEPPVLQGEVAGFSDQGLHRPNGRRHRPLRYRCMEGHSGQCCRLFQEQSGLDDFVAASQGQFGYLRAAMPMQHDQPVLLEQSERFLYRHLAQREVTRQL